MIRIVYLSYNIDDNSRDKRILKICRFKNIKNKYWSFKLIRRANGFVQKFYMYLNVKYEFYLIN